MKVFGCASYILSNSNSRDKLDPQAKRCYFIGYGFDMYGYRFWDDQNKKIIKSRNVTFNENIFYKDRIAEFANANIQPEHVSLEEISESDVVNRRRNRETEPESEPNSEPEQIIETTTPEVLIRRSS